MHDEYATLASPFRQHIAAPCPHLSVTLIASSLQSGTETRGLLNEPASELPGQGPAIAGDSCRTWPGDLHSKWLIFLRPPTVTSCSVNDSISVVPALLQIVYHAQRMDVVVHFGRSHTLNHLFLLHHGVLYVFRISSDPLSPAMLVAF